MSEFREKAGFDYYSRPQSGPELVIIEEALSISVVILHKKVLIGFFVNTPVELENGVEIEIPANPFDQRQRPSEFFFWCCFCNSTLTVASVFQNVPVVFAVYDRNPEFRVHHQPSVDDC